MNWPDPLNRAFPRIFVLCFAAILSPGLIVAQSAAQPEANLPSATSQGAVSDPGAADADAPANQNPAGQMRTAAQVEAEGERVPDPADLPAAVVTAAIPTASLTPPPTPAVVANPHEPSKYDVSLIGHRNIGTGVNFYSIEREIALGRDLVAAGRTKLEAGHRSGDYGIRQPHRPEPGAQFRFSGTVHYQGCGQR